jgi:putative tryptophan/tyrosine transport system substrate-binding protein
MRRREFLVVLGGTALTWPLAVRAQQGPTPVIGFISARSPAESASVEAAFRFGLKELGYVEGQNVHIAFRWAEGKYERLPALAADLVERKVAIIAAFGPPTAVAAKEATSTIPIVFNIGVDPVAMGLVPRFNRPGGNVTGVSFFTAALGAKRLGLLRELVSKPGVVAILVNSTISEGVTQARDLQEAAQELREQVVVLNAATDAEIEAAFTKLSQQPAIAIVVGSDPFFDSRRDRIIALAAHHAIPAIYHWREFAAAGGLMSYGASIADAYRQVGLYVARILRGEKAADLPIMQPTKFELVINLKTAKALGIDVPATVLARTDEVIE